MMAAKGNRSIIEKNKFPLEFESKFLCIQRLKMEFCQPWGSHSELVVQLVPIGQSVTCLGVAVISWLTFQGY